MLKEQAKSHFSSLYLIGRSVRDAIKNNKKFKSTAKIYTAVHEQNVEVDSPLAMIYVGDGSKRLNLIFSKFNQKALQTDALRAFLETGVIFAKNNHFELRIISRNCLPDSKAYVDFLKNHSISSPAKYSFYTDSATRVSSKTYRLSVSDNDVFFTEKETKKLKDWIKNGKY